MSRAFTLEKFDEYEVIPHTGNMRVWAEGVRDDYHSMDELYDHRRALNIALFHSLDLLHGITSTNVPRVHKAKNHHPTSDLMFEGYFIVFCIEAKSLAWTSYHYELKYWDDFKIPIAKFSPPYPLNHVDSIIFFSNLCWRH